MKRWFKRGALAGSAILLSALYFLLATQAGLHIVIDTVRQHVPGELTVQTASGDALGPFTLTGLRYQNANLILQIDELKIDWQIYKLLWNTLDLHRVHADGVQLSLNGQSGKDEAQRFRLPVNIHLSDTQITRLSIATASTTTPIQIDKINLRGRGTAQRINLDELQIQQSLLLLKSHGQIDLVDAYPLQLNLHWEYAPARLLQIEGNGQIQGDLHKLQISQQVSGDIEASLTGDITDMHATPQWRAHLQLRKVNSTQWNKPATNIVIAGALQGAGDFNEMQITGEVQTRTKKLGILFSTIKAQTANAFHDYALAVSGQWQQGDSRKATYAVDGNGTTQGIKLERVYIKTAEGTLRANAALQWLPQLSATANVALHNFDTSLFLPAIPGHVGAQATLQTSLENDKPVIALAVQALTGEIRGYELRGTAKAQWRQSHLNVEQLDVQLGDTRLNAHGRFASAWDVQWRIHSPNINAVLPGAHGQADFTGVIQGAHNEPQIQAEFTGAALSYKETAIGHIAGKLNLQPRDTAPLVLNLQAENISYADTRWRSGTIEVSGTNAVHSLQVKLDGTNAFVHSRVRGSYRQQVWRGVLAQLELSQEPFGRWELQQPSSFVLSAQQQQIDAICLQQQASHLCAQLDWQTQQSRLSLQGKAIPLSIVDYWLPEDILLDGHADVSLQLAGNATQHYRGSLDIATVAKAMSLNFTKQNVQIIFADTHYHADLTADGLSMQLALPLQNNAGVKANISLPKWSWRDPLAHSQSLQGAIKLSQLPLGTIAQFIPQLGHVNGNLNAHADLGGTLSEPRLSANAAWQDGSMELPTLNLNLRDIQAKLDSADQNRVKFSVTARSGDGNVQIVGETQLLASAGWPTQIHLGGDDLVISNTPQALVIIKPDLDIKIVKNTIQISGDVAIPRARLRPGKLSDGSVPVSSDVNITNGEPTLNREERWKISTRVRVQLGKLVDFDGFGVSGKLAGSLLLLDEPGKLSVGQGEVSILDGVYYMRGQNLTITHGRLIYANSVLDDPGIDVEATRVINDVTAGVRVKGTLKKPELTIFSEPAMGESDALAYLLLGHPLNQATTTEGQSVRDATTAMGVMGGDLLARDIGGRLGLDELRVEAGQTSTQTALVVGKYLSPRLYIRYFTGIVESSNIVQLRYQLSRNVQIQTESGYRSNQSITGGDIIFAIEY